MTSQIEEMPEEVHQHKEQLEGRSILVKKADVIPLEAIVRGYITGTFLERSLLGPGGHFSSFQALRGPNTRNLVRCMESRNQKAS